MEFKGTKNDWFITESWTDTQIELGTQEQPCIALFEKDWFSDEEEFRANISLIKHSKEMLEMLIKCREYFLLKTDLKNEERAEAIGELIEKATTI